MNVNPNGWKVESVGSNKDIAKVGAELREVAQEERRRLHFERLLAAPKISRDEYLRFIDAERAETLRDEDRPAMDRYAIESFYFKEIDLDLLEEDDEGRLQNKIRLYEILMANDTMLKELDAKSGHAFKPDQREYLNRKNSLVTLFSKAGIWNRDGFNIEARIDSSGLTDFKNECLKQEASLNRRFNVSLRKDLLKKPMSQLRDLLDLVGLDVVSIGRDQSGGKSIYIYQLDEGMLENVSGWVARRKDDDLVATWKREHDGEDEDD